jgi:hypothetical protein
MSLGATGEATLVAYQACRHLHHEHCATMLFNNDESTHDTGERRLACIDCNNSALHSVVADHSVGVAMVSLLQD